MTLLSKCDLIIKQYQSTFHNCNCIMKKAGFHVDLTFCHELHALVYCITELAIYQHGNNRIILGMVSESIFSSHLFQQIMPRIEFYENIIKGRRIHAFCFTDSNPSQLTRSVDRCVFAFCDCCLYPPFISNYGASRPVLDCIRIAAVSVSLFFPILRQMQLLYRQVSDILDR